MNNSTQKPAIKQQPTVYQESFAGGKFDKFGKLSMIHQTKTIQISTYN